MDVETILLEEVLNQNGVQAIDYLSVDIEGTEAEIVSDLVKKSPIQIKLFSIESNYGRPRIEFPGYKLIHQAGVDYFFGKA